MAVELITQAEYARRRQVDPTTVRDAIKAGRISLIDGKIDPAVADVQWERNTRARVKSTPPNASPTQAADRAGAPLPAGGESDYWVSRASRERAEAAIAEMKLAEMQGHLVRATDVTREVGQQAAALREALMQIDARLAPLVAIELDVSRCQALIREELRGVLERLASLNLSDSSTTAES
jgi:hypothetical protein